MKSSLAAINLVYFLTMKRDRLTMCALGLLTLLVGCNSYTIMQTNHFANDDGAIASIGYGQAKKDHVNTFISPANGREFDFKSKLVVDVHLPDWPEGLRYAGDEPPYDGESFTAWQCMNFRGGGTMYKTDNEEWYVLQSGFTCKIARRDSHVKTGYREVFSGVLCNTPVEAPVKDPRWRKIRPDQKATKK